MYLYGGRSLMTSAKYEPHRDKTNKMACAPSEDSDQPGHQLSTWRKPWSFANLLSAQRRLWSDWADAQADLSLRWAHIPFCWFCHDAAQLYVDGLSYNFGNKLLIICWWLLFAIKHRHICMINLHFVLKICFIFINLINHFMMYEKQAVQCPIKIAKAHVLVLRSQSVYSECCTLTDKQWVGEKI